MLTNHKYSIVKVLRCLYEGCYDDKNYKEI